MTWVRKQGTKEIVNVYSIGCFIFFILLLLSISLPTILSSFKLILLIILIILIIYIALKDKKLSISKELFLLSLFFSIFGLIYSFYGIVCDNPGATNTMTVMVLYPILFLLLSVYFRTLNKFTAVGQLLIYASLLVIIIQALFIFSAYGQFPSFIATYFQSLHPGHAVLDMTDEYVLFTLPNASSLIFLIPFLTAYILLSKKINIKLIILLLVMLILMLLTGRRAFLPSFGFSLFVLIITTLFFKREFESNLAKRLIGLGLILISTLFIAIISTQINYEVYIDKISTIFDFSTSESNLERAYQFKALAKGISNAPLFGNGAGATAEYTRSVEQPWAYELSYIALIFHYGFIGFLAYFLGVIYIIWHMIRICKDIHVSRNIKVFIFSFLTGLVAFLIANATNPYLGKFDYMWVIFIPIMIINTYKTERRRKKDI